MRKRTCLQRAFDHKFYIIAVVAVFGYLLFLNVQLNAEHRRTEAMEKQLQELTLQRLRDNGLDVRQGNFAPTDSKLGGNNIAVGQEGRDSIGNLRGNQRSEYSINTSADEQSPGASSSSHEEPIDHSDPPVPP